MTNEERRKVVEILKDIRDFAGGIDSELSDYITLQIKEVKNI